MAKSTRKQFGITGKALQGTRFLARDLDPVPFKMPATAVLVLNDNTGQAIGTNVYGIGDEAHLGRNFDPSAYTSPLPAKGDERWKKWTKAGYVPVEATDPRIAHVVEAIGADVPVEA